MAHGRILLAGIFSLIVFSSWSVADELDAVLLQRLTDEIDSNNIHAVLVYQNGNVLYEHYSSGKDEAWGEDLGVVVFDENSLHDLRSGTKSIVSALIGIAIGDGKIPSLDTPISSLLDKKHFASHLPPPGNKPMLLRHLLSMTAGFEWDESTSYTDPNNSEIQMWHSDAPVAFALSRPYQSAPGTEFHYNGGLTQVLVEILEESTGMAADDYAREKLFSPLKIEEFTWVQHESGQVWGASGLRLKAEDFAKIGLLYMQNGRWADENILPDGWVGSTFTPQIDTGFSVTIDYGLHWWLPAYVAEGQPISAAMATGNGGQTLLLFPEHDLLIVILAGYYNQIVEMVTLPHRLAQEYILPAVGIDGSRPARSGVSR
jgi:CubicO group peptidase (beta-lactamase class C family)